MTRSPIEIEEPPFQYVAATLSPSSSTTGTESISVPNFSVALPVVVTRSPIDIEKASTKALPPSSSVPADLSSIYVLRRLSQEITDYITPGFPIEQRIYINDICSSNVFKELAWMDRDLDRTFHTYFMGSGK